MESEMILRDFEIASRLHKELNGFEVEPPQSMKAQMSESVISLSDDESFTQPKIELSKRDRSRSPISNGRPEVSIENQQAIVIQKERKSRDDYYMPLMNTYINMSLNQEWKIVNMESNIQQMFDKLQLHFFSKWLKNIKYIVKWDTTGVIQDGSCFKIFESHKEILIKTSAMVQPRISVISVLLHILIHIYLASASKGSVKINTHDENFRKIMLFLNQTLNTKISTFHKFLFSPDEAEYSQQWYQCTGICSSYEPFHGTIRCTTIPDESHSFFKAHDEECGGQYFRIFEMTRQNPETNETEKVYVKNTHYMFPKPRAAGKNLRANQQVRELYDLTDDTEESPTVQNLCDVINLDDSEYAIEADEDGQLVNNFTKQTGVSFPKCPFCNKFIGITRLSEHFDKCRGYQQKVEYKLKK